MSSKSKKNLITDIEGVLVGNANDAELKSGVTVVTCKNSFVASVSILGGAPGSRETDLLKPSSLVDKVDAIVLSGGSAFGLEASSGVMDCLREQKRGYAVGDIRVPIVPSAILFDLNNGGNKDWQSNPYPSLGRKAFESASDNFSLGTEGAGTGAVAGDVKGGLGSASLILEGGIAVGALVAVNSLGSPLVSGSKHFWAAPFEVDNEFGGFGLAKNFDALSEPDIPKLKNKGGNTTLAVIATNASLDKAGCERLSIAAHDGIARALFPAHSIFDGDCVFALSTGRGKALTPADQVRLGHGASVCLARAIARAVYEATPASGDLVPTINKK